jgi:hypothetical protein
MLTAAVRTCRVIMEETLEDSEMAAPVYFDPLACFGEEADLEELVSSNGNTIWRYDNMVHLSEAAYQEIGLALLEMANSDNTPGRKRISSIVEDDTPRQGGPRGRARGRGGYFRGGLQHGDSRGRGQYTDGRDSRFHPYI